MAKDYDVIVVGGGPGGSAAAKTAAEAGLKVLQLERAAEAGQKNMSGSMFFVPMLEQIWPNYAEADFMRTYPIIEGGTMGFMEDDGWGFTAGVHYGSERMANGPMIFRNESDKWLHAEAGKAGAEQRCAVARDLIWGADGSVQGVIVDEGEEIHAPITIAADGINSLLAKRSGLAKVRRERDGERGEGMTLCVKYIYYMGEEECAKRSKAEYWEEDGMYHEYDSEPVWSGRGSDDLAPYQDTWTAHALLVPSAGVVTVAMYQHVSDLCRGRKSIHQRMKWFCSTPEIRHATEGAEFIRMDAHILTWQNRDGYASKTYLPGFMLVGDAAAMINPMDGFGADAAMYAGRVAAQVAKKAIDANDFSENILRDYEIDWRESFVGRNEHMPRHLAGWMFNNQFVPPVRTLLDKMIDSKLGCVAYKDFVNSPEVGKAVLQLAPMVLSLGNVLKEPAAELTDTIGNLLGVMSDD